MKRENADDTISRQAALDAIRNIRALKGTFDGEILLIDKAEAQTELMMLPAAQPTQTNAESTQDFGRDTNVPSNDCISRQAAIEAVGYYSLHSGDKLLFADKPLKELPSAQLAQDLHNSCTDTISRNAALDAVRKYDFFFPQYMERFVTELRDAMKSDLVNDIKTLPAAQPEIIRCKDCKHRPIATRADEGVLWGFSVEFPDEICPFHCEDGWYNYYPKDDFYCANAERRTDG